jgi:hypothetical protein
MPIHKVQAPDGKIYSVDAPEGATDSQIFRFVQSQMQQPQLGAGPTDYSKMSTAELESAPSAPTSIGDIGRSLGVGLIGGAKTVADVFGAGNDASNYLGQKAQEVQAGISPERQAEMARRQELEKRATASGSFLQEAKTFLGGVAEAPIQSVAQALGTSAPTLAASLATVFAAPEGALALGVVRLGQIAMGTAQGVGEYKGSVHDEVKKAYLEKGYKPEEAERLAIQAQEYSMDKALEIGGSGLLGALDAFTGIEGGVRKAIQKAGKGKLSKEAVEAGIKELPEKAVTAPSLGGAALRSIVGEAPLEGLQGGFGQYAQNLAMQREGLLEGDVTQGVLGSALRDAAVGALTGGAFTPVKMSEMRSDYNLDQYLRQQKEQIEFDKELAAATANAPEAPAEAPPETYDLPGGHQVIAENVGQFEAPVEHHIMEEGGTAPLATVQAAEEVGPKIERLNEIRKQEAAKTLEQVEKINEGIKKQEQAIEVMEATGQANTPEYTAARQKVEQDKDVASQQIKELMDRNEYLSRNLVHMPGEVQTQTQQQFTLTKDGQPIGTFPSMQEAENVVREAVGPEVFTQHQEQQQQQTFNADQIAALKATLETKMQQFGLSNVGLEIVKQLENGAGGKYLNRLVSIALDEPNPVQTMRHESVHALKDLGFFTPQQWSVLQNMAKNKWVNEYLGSQQTEIDGQRMSRLEGYRKLGLTEDEIIEEAIADAFGSFDIKNAPPGMLASLHAKLKKFFEALKNGFTGAGFQTAESVFGKIERGELKPSTAKLAGAEKLSLPIVRGEEVPKFEAPLKEGETKPAKLKPTVDLIGKYFDDQVKERSGSKLSYNDSQSFDNAVKAATEEVKHQLAQEKSGLDWYEEDIKEAFKQTRKFLPELGKTDNRLLFSVMAGIMSPQTNARDNWNIAAKAYEHYVATKDIPGNNPETGGLWQGGTQSPNKKIQLEFLDRMVKDMGQKKALEWLFTDHSVKEINDFRQKYGNIKSGIGGKLTDTVPGLYAFGPKVGPFVSNLNGIHDVTVDKWMTRTFNRYFGTMTDADGKIIDAPTEPQRKAVKALVNEVAKNAGIKPYQVQSLLWFYEQQLFTKMGVFSPSYGFSDGAAKYAESRGGRGGEKGVSPVAKATPSGLKSKGEKNEPTTRSEQPAERPGTRGKQAKLSLGERGGREEGRTITPLADAPSVEGFHGPDPRIVAVAEKYAAQKGISLKRQASYVDVDEDRARRLADEYAAMEHAPQDPKVKAAYQDLIRQTEDQYRALEDAGYKFWFIDTSNESNLEYLSSPWNAMRDIRANKEMGVYPTNEGFGSEENFSPEANPLLEKTNIEWPIGGPNGPLAPVLANDLFRAVHDAFGHGIEGAGFRARGEENAWQAHARLFTGPAIGALTSETRGQNSWVNFGPEGQKNKSAKAEDTVFADQKAGLMPEWTWNEGRAGDMQEPAKGGVTLGTKQPNASTFTGTHYGTAKVQELSGSKYGTGIRGAERRRLEDAFDERIKNRVYFYVPKEDGTMPLREAGLGQYVYSQQFDNILGPGPEMSKLFTRAQGDSNNFETEVIDAGYDGYAVPSMGMMVVLNHNAPVNYLGTVSELAEKGGKQSLKRVSFDSVREAKAAVKEAGTPDTPEFKKFIRQTQFVNPDGTPKVMYHGTSREFYEFTPAGEAQAIFISESPEEAEGFASEDEDRSRKMAYAALRKEEKVAMFQRATDKAVEQGSITKEEAKDIIRKVERRDPKYGSFFGGDLEQLVYDEINALSPAKIRIMPLYASGLNIFDYQNPDHVNGLYQWIVNNSKVIAKKEANGVNINQFLNRLKGAIEEGYFATIEQDFVQEAIRKNGFDGFAVRENKAGKKNYAVYNSYQLKSATGNEGAFNREVKDVRYSLPQISAGAENRINETTTVREEKGFFDRMMSALKPENYSMYRQQFLNRYNELSVADKEAAKKMGGVTMMAENSAEHAALMSDMHAGVTASAFGIGGRSGGVPVIKNGLTTIDDSKKGLLEILQPLAKYSDPKAYRYFQFYSAVKRGARLYSEGRERLIQPGDVAFAQELAQKFPEFEQIRKDWVEYNNHLIAYQKAAGVLSERDAQEYTKYYDYIPFFRQLDGEKTMGPNIYQSISGVKKPKALKGGEAPLADFLETVVRNSQSAIAAGMKNIAAQRARDVGKQAGVVHDIQPGKTVSDLEKIKVLENGVMKEYQSDDPLFVDAVKSLHMPDIPFMGLLSGPSNLLREAVTRDPGFILANLVRDSLSAYATSGQNITPISDTVINFGKAYARKSPGFEALMNAGVIGGYEFSENVEQSGRTVAKELSKRAGNKGPVALRPFTSLWDGLEKATTASDAATRVAVYDRVMRETGNEAEAIRAAWEILNFNRKGSSPIIRVLTAAVPFLNARLQGLDVFYRAATGNMNTSDAKLIQRRFIARAAMMFATSFLYAAAVAGDPDYEAQEDETKDNNWIVPGVRLKIPIPFEVGTLFKTIPERIYRYSFGNDTGQDLRDSLYRATLSTLPINPVGYVPQVFKPMVEAMTNYNMFTGREIVGQGMKDVAPEFQVGPGTSSVAEFVGKTLGMSPLKVDHVIKGYTGTMGMYAIDLMDSVMGLYGDSPKPNKRFEQMPVIKRFMADPEARGSVTAYYKLKDEVDTVVRTVNLLEKSMKPDEFAKYLGENMGTLAFKDYVRNMEKDMKQFREMKQMIISSPMSGSEKKDALSTIGQAENNLTANIQQIKKAISETR